MIRTDRYLIYRATAFLLMVLLLPLFGFFYLLVKLSSKGPFLFMQKRLGKNRKTFVIYKIRTMIDGAEARKRFYSKQNEAKGPVFKIYHDPRYTKIGKLISHTGLDELPQLANIVKGEMSFVGPRPLPVAEALKIPIVYRRRFSVLPGITSSWTTNGSHRLSFKRWMELDLDYAKNNSLWNDLSIMVKTLQIIAGYIVISIRELFQDEKIQNK